MKLSYAGIQDRAAWERAGVALPKFDWKEMRSRTEAAPVWVHFGGGNIFRGFIARLQQELLNQGLADRGITAVSAHSRETIEKIYRPYDCMTLLVSLLPDGTMDKEVIASVAEGLCAGADAPQDVARLRAIFRSPSLQMVSLPLPRRAMPCGAWTAASCPGWRRTSGGDRRSAPTR